MSDQLAQQICDLFETELDILISDVNTDLIEEGLLDSMILVDLIVHLETQFKIEIPVAKLEFDQFRTVTGIAHFLVSLDTGVPAQNQGSAA